MKSLEIERINKYNNTAMIKKLLLTTTIFLMLTMPIKAFDYTTRTNLSLDESISDQNGTKYMYPEQIYVTRVESLDDEITSSPQDWIDAIYYYSITRLGFADLPYNFFIDESGNIYQGRKGYVGVVPELSTEKGSVVIGYLSSRASLTSRAKSSLAEIYEDLSQKYGIDKDSVYATRLYLKTQENALSYVTSEILDDNFSTAIRDALKEAKEYDSENLEYSAKIENLTFEETIQVGEKLPVSLNVMNMNDYVWFNTPDNIYVSTKDEEETVFAINGTWDSFSRPTHLSKDYILPGESIEVKFSLQANSLPGEKEIDFKFLKYPEQEFENSSFKIDFEIQKGDKELGEVSSPEGYLNVRECPGSGCEIITTVENGQVFIIKDTQDAWKKIEYEENQEGWVFIRYITSL